MIANDASEVGLEMIVLHMKGFVDKGASITIAKSAEVRPFEVQILAMVLHIPKTSQSTACRPQRRL